MPAQAGTVPAPGLIVEDQRARRIRRPVDLLRCLLAVLGIVVAVGIGLLAGATARGVQIDAVGASSRLPHPVLALLGVAATLALLLWPAALAIRQLTRRQPRRLAEAVLTGGATIALVALANTALLHGAAAPLYDALAIQRAGAAGPLDGYLAGLAAYATIIGLTGPSRWRTALWLAVGVYAIATLATASITVLSLVITLLLGRAIGLGVRYAAGEWSQRPTAEEIAAGLGSAGHPVTVMRRTRQEGSESRRYAATARGGERLDVRVFDRDQEAAGALYRLYRWLRLQGQVRRDRPLTLERAVERRALLSYAADEAGVRTPRLLALISVGSDATVLAHEQLAGTTLARLASVPDGSGPDEPGPAGTPRPHPDPAGPDPARSSQARQDRLTPARPGRPGPQTQPAGAADSAPTDDQLLRVWEAVLQLHAHRVTHRALTGDRIMFADDGDVVLLDPGNGDVAATDLQLRLDLAQLLAELALLVGPDRTARLAAKAVGADELVAVVPLLQPIVLYRSTRAAVRRRRDVLPALRKQLLDVAPGEDAPPVRLERVRPRSVVTLIASLVAGYLLLGQLGRVSLLSTLKAADWRWAALALALSAVTYLGAAWSLSGYVPGRLRVRPAGPRPAGRLVRDARHPGRRRRCRAEHPLPPAPEDPRGGRGRQRRPLPGGGLRAASPAAGRVRGDHRQPGPFAPAADLGLLRHRGPHHHRARGRCHPGRAAGCCAPGWRRCWARSLPRLLAVMQQPRKLAEGIGGALLLTGAYILCLDACIRALGGSIPLASTAVVYLTGAALGSAVPTPGGLGAVEAALSAGLTAAGLPGTIAVSAVLLFRTLTFWLPVPVGWGAFNYLERHEYI